MKLIVVPRLNFNGIVCEGYAVCQCAKIYDLILFQVLKFRVITVRLNILTLRDSIKFLGIRTHLSLWLALVIGNQNEFMPPLRDEKP